MTALQLIDSALDTADLSEPIADAWALADRVEHYLSLLDAAIEDTLPPTDEELSALVASVH